MKKIFKMWEMGWECLLFDDLISYYAFFTIAFTECFYLFTFHEQTLAIKLSMILIGYVVIILILARFKYISIRSELPILGACTIGFSLLFIVGCCINLKLCLLLTFIPFISSFIFIILRGIQDSFELFKKQIYNTLLEGFLMFLTIGLPFILFTIFLCLIPLLPIALKIIIPIVYLAIAPFISYIEDNWACNNIFELFCE